jgi:peptidoglycan hydrolase CwlO-like protein
LNIYEVIFLVIFFNVLLATTAGPKGAEDQKRSGGQSNEDGQILEKIDFITNSIEPCMKSVNSAIDKIGEMENKLNTIHSSIKNQNPRKDPSE